MQCPVCNDHHIIRAEDLMQMAPDRFTPCSLCPPEPDRLLFKRAPLPSSYELFEPCVCKKRFMDDVIAHIYLLFVEEGIFSGNENLFEVGMPVPDPGLYFRHPPYLPARSLLLLTPHITDDVSYRLMQEIPELLGIVVSDSIVPGISVHTDGLPVQGAGTHTYRLSAGCDVRADIFPGSAGSCAIYKQQSCMHIEFPRGYNPKIRSVEKYLKRIRPRFFVDACSGSGTLGITAALHDVPHVVLNDAWYAAAFFSGFNLLVNQESLGFEEVIIHADYQEMQDTPVRSNPILIAEAYGDGRSCKVYHGDLWHLSEVFCQEPDLTVIDPFDKENKASIDDICERWRKSCGGEVFIP